MYVEKLIEKYFRRDSPIFIEYYSHTSAVALKSLDIAYKIELPQKRIEFIYEASMLHDIGISQIPKIFQKSNFLGLNDKSHYIKGYEILLSEGYPEHANVALRHSLLTRNSKTISRDRLVYHPITLEERIIAYSSLYISQKCENEESTITSILQMTKPHGNQIYKNIFDIAVEFGDLSYR